MGGPSMLRPVSGDDGAAEDRAAPPRDLRGCIDGPTVFVVTAVYLRPGCFLEGVEAFAFTSVEAARQCARTIEQADGSAVAVNVHVGPLVGG